MKFRIAAIAAAALFVVACEKSSTAPATDESASLLLNIQATLDSVSFLPEGTMAVGAAPDSIRLTDAQKAAIKALHDKFAADHKAKFDELAAIRREAAAAVKAGKTRTEVAAILAKGKPIMEAMRADFDALRAAVAAILTPAQKAWAASHQRIPVGPGPLGAAMPGRNG